MSTKAEIQGVALALFGAYAGAYLKDLTDQANKGSVVGVASGLVLLQPALLAFDFASSDAWVDNTLGNLGVDAKNSAAAPAKAWFLMQLGLGRSKADALTEAVRFLLGIANGAVSDSKYEVIADAFDAHVVQGIRWSEDTGPNGGSTIKALVDLKAKASAFKPPTGPSKPADNPLALALVSVLAAADALAAGNSNANSPTDSITETAELKAESLIRESLGDATFAYNQNESSTGQTPASNALEDVAEARAVSQWLDIQQESATLFSQALSDLNFMRQGASAQVEAYLSQVGVLFDNREALTKAENELVETLSLQNPSFPNGSVAFEYDDAADILKLLYLLDNRDEVIATFTAGQWTDGPATGAASALYKSLSETFVSAWKVAASREASVKQILTNLENLNDDLTSAENTASIDGQTYLTGDADFYVGAALAKKESEALISSAKEALLAVKQARGGQTDNSALQKALADAKTEFIAQGYTFDDLRNGDQKTATSQDNVYDIAALKGGANAARITNLGAQGNDGLVVHGYTQTTLLTGDNAALEFKIQQTGADVLLTFESVPNGFSTTVLGASAEFTVTLIGIDMTKLTITDNLILT